LSCQLKRRFRTIPGRVRNWPFRSIHQNQFSTVPECRVGIKIVLQTKDNSSMNSLDWSTAASAQYTFSDLNLLEFPNNGADLQFWTDKWDNQGSSSDVGQSPKYTAALTKFSSILMSTQRYRLSPVAPLEAPSRIRAAQCHMMASPC